MALAPSFNAPTEAAVAYPAVSLSILGGVVLFPSTIREGSGRVEPLLCRRYRLCHGLAVVVLV